MVVVGNNAEDTGIQTVDSPVDAQIGSWMVVDDVTAADDADPMVERRKFPGWVAVGSNQTVNLVLATE